MAITLPKLNQQGQSGPGGVEIAGFPQVVHTRSFGHPDVLFIPLINEARAAISLCQRLAADESTREQAAAMSGIQLVSGLLRDPSFALSVRGLQEEHYYYLDLAAGTIRVQTRLYAEVSRRTSMFKVEITGRIPEGIYTVCTIGDFPSTYQFDEDCARHALFFSTVLAEECLRVRVQQERTVHPDLSSHSEWTPEVRLTVDQANKRVPVILKKGPGDHWELLDEQLRPRFGTLSLDAAHHLQLLLTTVSNMVEEATLSRQPGLEGSLSLASAVKDRSKS